MAAMMTASVGITSCNNDEGGSPGGIKDEYVGTWVCNDYYVGDRDNLLYPMGDLYDLPTTTVILNSNGKCSGSGIVIDGQGTFSVKSGNVYDDGYWAIFTFKQNGQVVCTATLKTFTNDHKKAWVRLSSYEGKTFIFKKR